MTKRFISKIALFVLITFLLGVIPGVAFGEQTQVDIYENQQLVRSVIFIVGIKEYFINGQTPGVRMDVAPYLDSDRTFVPVRYLGYALGVKEQDVGWSNAEQKASLRRGPHSVEMVIGSRTIITGGQPKEIDVAPQLRYARTFLPARYVAEGLGFEVEWRNLDGKDYVICWPKGEAKPEADIEKVKNYIDQVNTAPDVKPMSGILVTSEKDLEGISPVYVRPWPNLGTKVYKGYVKASDLPVKVDGYVVYSFGLKNARIEYEGEVIYEGEIVTIVADTQYFDLHIIEKNGQVRDRQPANVKQLGDSKWEIDFALQHTGELSDGKPPVDVNNVKYFVVNTHRIWPVDEIGLLFIDNPYQG
ncbi:copper amine oxidase N-terminal domain-containing protein [Moorellaceae bacterium AZ2]